MFFIRKFFGNYFGIPKLAWFFVPLIVLDNLAVSLILNIPIYLEKLHNIHQFGTGKVISLYYAGCLLGAFSGGYLTLKRSSINVSSISMAVYGLLFLKFSSVTSLGDLELLALFIGIFGAVASTSNLAGFVRTSGAKSSITQINLEMIIFNACFSVVSYALLTLPLETITFCLKSLAVGMALSGVFILVQKNNSTFAPVSNRKSTKSRKGGVDLKPLVGLFTTVFLFGLIFSMIKVIYTPTVEARFGGNGEAAFMASLNPWIVLVIQPHLVAWLKGRFDYNFTVMGVGGFMVGVGYFLFGVSGGFLASSLSIVILTFGEVLYGPISKNIAKSSVSEEKAGFVLGLWRAIFLGSGFLGPLISGWLSENYGNLVVWELCAVAGFLCLVVAVIMRTNSQFIGISAK